MPVRAALIGGSGLDRLDLLSEAVAKSLSTPYGPPSSDVFLGRIGGTEVAFLPRHGRGRTIPPHRINHRANLWALKELGVRRVIASSSVGSLRREVRPGSLTVPHDFLSPWNIPTFYDEKVVHITPGLDDTVRRAILTAAKRAHVPVRARAVYAQTIGPRLETKAEIQMLAKHADVVGMTMASEATLSLELGLAYACLCTVDNYAHGIAPGPLSYDRILATSQRNAEKVADLMPAILKALAGNV